MRLTATFSKTEKEWKQSSEGSPMANHINTTIHSMVSKIDKL